MTLKNWKVAEFLKIYVALCDLFSLIYNFSVSSALYGQYNIDFLQTPI